MFLEKYGVNLFFISDKNNIDGKSHYNFKGVYSLWITHMLMNQLSAQFTSAKTIAAARITVL